MKAMNPMGTPRARSVLREAKVTIPVILTMTQQAARAPRTVAQAPRRRMDSTRLSDRMFSGRCRAGFENILGGEGLTGAV